MGEETTSIWLKGNLLRDPEHRIYGNQHVAYLLVGITLPDGTSDCWHIHARGRTAAYLKDRQVRKGDLLITHGALCRRNDRDGEWYVKADLIAADTSLTYGDPA